LNVGTTVTEPLIQYATTADGVRVACWTLGDGPPLVYLAGGPWSHVELPQAPACRGWYERLAETRLLVRYDVRGTGWSERAVADYSLDALTLDVEAVVQRLGLARFALLAAADAGPVAIAYAARHPEQVTRLVLWCSWARAADVASPRLMAWLRSIDDDWEFMTDACAQLALGWSAGETGRHAARRLRESVTPETARAALTAMGTFDVTALLPRLTMPALVLHRRDIAWIPVAVARGLAARIPDARLILLDGESIAPYLGDAGAAARAIEAFLSEGDQERARREDAGMLAPAPDQSGAAHNRAYPDGLTKREVEVLRLLAGGSTNVEIAEALSVSVRTVERHVANIYAKIAARGRANATAYALTHRLV
jgi:pimeloyl-ACP methyl ester carboxylesterase/DNA-binding CsgD family transcriptional regulator